MIRLLKLGKVKLFEHVAYLKEEQENYKYFSRRNILRIVIGEGRIILKRFSNKPAMNL
jgi:hypothetical protein